MGQRHLGTVTDKGKDGHCTPPVGPTDPAGVRACRTSLRRRPGLHPGHPTAVGGLPASEPGLGAGAHDLGQQNATRRPTPVPLPGPMATWRDAMSENTPPEVVCTCLLSHGEKAPSPPETAVL